MTTKDKIGFPDFLEIEKKLDIRYGQIVAVERINKKMLKLSVIFGEDEADEKTVVTNIGGQYGEDELLAVMFPFIVNLEPATISGFVSEAMIMLPKTTELHLEPRMGATLL